MKNLYIHKAIFIIFTIKGSVVKRILSISLMALSYGNMSSASETPNKFVVATFNIDTNIARTEEGYARDSHPQWRVGERMPKIITSLNNIIATDQPDVIHLQEGRKFTTKFGDEVDSINPLMEYLASQDYHVTTEQYNPSDRAFSFITAIKNKFAIDGYEKIYLTKTPDKPTDHSLPLADIKDNNFGEEWERCALISNFRDQEGRKYRATNIHLGVSQFHRKQACQMLQQNALQTSITNPKILQILTGDMNTFPDWGGPAQLAIMAQDGVLQEVTENLQLQNGQHVNSTFISFPFDFAADEQRLNTQSVKDIGKPLVAILAAMEAQDRKEKIGQTFATECKALNGKLDRVYQHGFKKASATLRPTPQFNDFNHESFDESTVKNFIMRHHHEGPAFASDHQPVVAILEIPQEK